MNDLIGMVHSCLVKWQEEVNDLSFAVRILYNGRVLGQSVNHAALSLARHDDSTNIRIMFGCLDETQI